MKNTVAATLLSLATVSATSPTSLPHEFTNTVKLVNQAKAGWLAEVPAQFLSKQSVQVLCGALLTESPTTALPDAAKQPTPDAAEQPTTPSSLPLDFDSRTTWPNCTIIAKVGSQAGCGDCWAWSATQTMESFMCIKGLLKADEELSKEDTAECCSGALCGYSQSCTAGTPFAALTWIANRGVVSGGAYNSSQGCKPYSLAPCSVLRNGTLPACHEPHPPPTLKCEATCSNTQFKTSYASDKRGDGLGYRPTSMTYRGDNNTHALQYLVDHGPMAATFSVMEDFPTYRGGIYKHVTGKFLGTTMIFVLPHSNFFLLLQHRTRTH